MTASRSTQATFLLLKNVLFLMNICEAIIGFLARLLCASLVSKLKIGLSRSTTQTNTIMRTWDRYRMSYYPDLYFDNQLPSLNRQLLIFALHVNVHNAQKNSVCILLCKTRRHLSVARLLLDSFNCPMPLYFSPSTSPPFHPPPYCHPLLSLNTPRNKVDEYPLS